MSSAVFGARQVQPSKRLRQVPHHLSRQTRTPLYRQSQVKATTTDISFCESYADAERSMLSRVKKLLSGMRGNTGKKLIIGIAGIPGSGKTTSAHNVLTQLNETEEIAVVVPMDGCEALHLNPHSPWFHYYRCDLDLMPDPAVAHDRRGAAFTFNSEVFLECLRRLWDSSQTARPIPFPSFDHIVGDPVQDDVWVKPTHQVVLVEGLYLLRDEKPWGDLDEIFDETWLLRVDVDVAMNAVVARQVDMGVREGDARTRVNANDRVNADEVYSMCRRPDFVVDISRIKEG